MHPEIPDGLSAIRQHWTFRDLMEAWFVIDALDEARPEPKPQTPFG